MSIKNINWKALTLSILMVYAAMIAFPLFIGVMGVFVGIVAGIDIDSVSVALETFLSSAVFTTLFGLTIDGSIGFLSAFFTRKKPVSTLITVIAVCIVSGVISWLVNGELLMRATISGFLMPYVGYLVYSIINNTFHE